MGIYVPLFARYLRVDRRMLITSLRDAKIEILRDVPSVWTLSTPARPHCDCSACDQARRGYYVEDGQKGGDDGPWPPAPRT